MMRRHTEPGLLYEVRTGKGRSNTRLQVGLCDQLHDSGHATGWRHVSSHMQAVSLEVRRLAVLVPPSGGF